MRGCNALAVFVLAGIGGALLPGCGYKAGWLIPPEVRSVHVKVMTNETFWREAVKTDNLPTAAPPATPWPAYTMEVELTERLKNEIVRRTPLKLADEKAADSVLETSIVAVKAKTLFTDAADGLLGQRVTVQVDFAWVDRRSGRVIAKGSRVSRPTVFVVARGESFTTAARRSFDYIAERIVEGMQEGF